MSPGEHTILSCASHSQVSACIGPYSLLHMDMKSMGMWLILLALLQEQCPVF